MLAAASKGYSVITPAVVIRPILLVPVSVNQSAPSGPVVIATVPLLASKGYSVITPAVVIRPILLAVSVNQSAPSGPAVIPEGLLSTGYSVILIRCATELAHNPTNNPVSQSGFTITNHGL